MKSEINEKQVNILIERKKSLIVSKTVMGIILIPLILLSLFIWVFIWTVLLYFLFIPLIIILFLKLSSINKELTDINFKLAGASEKIRTKGFEIERKQKEFDSNIKNYFHKPEHKIYSKLIICVVLSLFIITIPVTFPLIIKYLHDLKKLKRG